MATNTALRFYKKKFDSNDASLRQAGAIVFDTSAQVIYVGGELATSNVIDASFDSSSKLTITRHNGENVVLDFSDVASASGTNVVLSGLRTDINNLQTATGVADGATAPNYSDASILVDASTMVDADKILAKAIYDLSAGVEGLDVDPFAQASVSGSTITINGIEETNGKIASTDSSKLEIVLDGTYDATDNKIATKSTVTDAINALDAIEVSLGTDETVATISEADGVISVTKQTISITHDKVSDWASNVGVTAVGEGTTNGTISVTTNGGSAADVSVHGLGSAAYESSTAFATAAQGEKADSALQTVSATGDTYIDLSFGDKTNNTQALGAAVKIGDVSTATADASGLATAYAVQTYVDNKTADLSGAMHFRSVISSSGSTVIDQINSYYTSSGTTPEVGDVFVDSARGEEWVVKSLPSSGNLTTSNIEMFGTVDPSTVVTSVAGSTSTTGLVVTPTTSTTGAVTVTVDTSTGYQIPTTTQMTKVDNIAVDTTTKSVTDGTNTLSDLVSDADYKHITVSATDGVSDASGVTYKYEHPTTTAATAAAVKVGNDGLGHVVLGDALAAGDIAFSDASFTAQNVGGALTELNGKITAANITIDNHVGAITTGDGLTDVATDGGSFGIKLNDSSLNGLSVDASGLGLALATTSTNGAIDASSYEKLQNIEAGAEVNIIESVKLNGKALAVDSTDRSVNVTAIQSVAKGTDGSYVSVDVSTVDNAVTVSVDETIQDVSTSGDSSKGLAEASNVKAYVDYKAAEAAAVVDMSTPIQVNDGSTVIATVGDTSITAEVQFNWEAYE